jgi:hypothetical protein
MYGVEMLGQIEKIVEMKANRLTLDQIRDQLDQSYQEGSTQGLRVSLVLRHRIPIFSG